MKHRQSSAALKANEKKAIPLRRGTVKAPPAPGTSESQADRQLIVALARGLKVLGAFRMKDGPLGNGELAERTEIPTATVSRITHTLTRAGYLAFNPKQETYDLGPMAVSLGLVALKRLNVREIARPEMQKLANEINANVGLGLREGLSIINVETCDGPGLVGLRLVAGSRMPIATTAMGKAYVAALADDEREALYEELQPRFEDRWGAIKADFDHARNEIAEHGFCVSIGTWQGEINGAAAPLVLPESGVYSINIGGPAYQLPESDIREQYGPRLVATVAKIRAQMVPVE